MGFGIEKTDDYVVGRIAGHIITANFGENDRMLFLFMGAALVEIQCFEFSVAHAVSLIIAPRSEGKGLGDDFNDIVEDNFNKRLARLIHVLRKHGKDHTYADTLEQARKSRNFLVHEILRKFEWPMDKDDGYLRALLEIKERRNDIHNAEMACARILADRTLLDVIVLHYDEQTAMSEF
jgi:hypothetical protein